MLLSDDDVGVVVCEIGVGLIGFVSVGVCATGPGFADGPVVVGVCAIGVGFIDGLDGVGVRVPGCGVIREETGVGSIPPLCFFASPGGMQPELPGLQPQPVLLP